MTPAPELERVDASTVASVVRQGLPDVAVVDVRNDEVSRLSAC